MSRKSLCLKILASKQSMKKKSFLTQLFLFKCFKKQIQFSTENIFSLNIIFLKLKKTKIIEFLRSIKTRVKTVLVFINFLLLICLGIPGQSKRDSNVRNKYY